MEIRITMHAEQKRISWGISKQDIKNAIKRGKKVRHPLGQKVAWYTWFGVVYRTLGDGAYKVITLKDRMRRK